MMCSECGVRPANMHLTMMVNGEIKEKHLCPTCMDKYKQFLPEHMNIPNLGNLLEKLLKKAEPSVSDTEEADIFDAVCPSCHTTYAQYKETGLVGCMECYKTFREPIEEMLVHTQGTARRGSDRPIQTEQREDTDSQKLEKLKNSLTQAISEERYEDAAVLRDQIRALSAKTEKGGDEA